MRVKKPIPLPQTVFLDDGHKRLYSAEKRLSEWLQTAAKELGAVLGHKPDEFWDKSMPSAILAMLSNSQKDAATAAAVAFCQEQGLTVEPKGKVVPGRFGSARMEIVDGGLVETFYERGEVAA